jgi:type II restriction enzyme
MNLDDLLDMYEKMRSLHGNKAYLHISELYEKARERYKGDYLRSKRAKQRRDEGKVPDAEQSWKVFKGNSFEKLILHIIGRELTSTRLKCIRGSVLAGKNLTAELDTVHRNLLVRFGRFGLLPDADLVLYDPKTCKVLGIISCKITLRERIAQTAYWKLKLASSPTTMHIKAFFVTADEDEDLVEDLSSTPSRNRIIIEHELDGTYTLRKVSESDKVKTFPKLIGDLRRLIQNAS